MRRIREARFLKKGGHGTVIRASRLFRQQAAGAVRALYF
jgi:hypothetical protein